MKPRDVLYRGCLIAVFFIVWGIIWLAFYHENIFEKLLSGFFIAFGLFLFIKYYYKLKKGDTEILADERSELNMLKASRMVFVFLAGSIAFLFTLLGLKLINEILFVTFMYPVFAIALVSYALAYYRYDRGMNEKQD